LRGLTVGDRGGVGEVGGRAVIADVPDLLAGETVGALMGIAVRADSVRLVAADDLAVEVGHISDVARAPVIEVGEEKVVAAVIRVIGGPDRVRPAARVGVVGDRLDQRPVAPEIGVGDRRIDQRPAIGGVRRGRGGDGAEGVARPRAVLVGGRRLKDVAAATGRGVDRAGSIIK
jgi:hypothetical protein